MTHLVSLRELACHWRLPGAHRTSRALIYLLAFFSLLLTGCQPVVASATPTQAASYSLMVINGSGGGKYQAGSIVHVWADPYQQGWTFDMWKGETQAVPEVRSMHATITMPPQDIRIKATYKQIPLWSVSFASMFGRDVYYYFPPLGYKG